MALNFKRITSSGNFIPEIDGLRFIAVTSVVLYHFWCFLNVKDKSVYKDAIDYSFLERILSHGNFGVPLFFAISGFILGMPFARHHLQSAKKVDLKSYFLRRLTRLEPPYILCMIVFFFGSVYVAHTVDFAKGIASFFASVFYIHNFVWPGKFPFLNGVAWSLEIEVQFYVLAPLLSIVFAIGDKKLRRVLIALLAFAFVAFGYVNPFPFISLLNFLQYFLVGFLLADYYVTGDRMLPQMRFGWVVALLLLCAIWLYEKGDFASDLANFAWECFQLCSMFLIYYFILFAGAFKPVMTNRLVTNIGGMCYSIYLLHYSIISMVGNPMMRYQFSSYSFINVAIYCAIWMIPITICCAAFFLLVERPCMDKNWYKKLFRSKKEPLLN